MPSIRGFGEDHREHACARGAERAEHADDAATLDDGEAHRAEDQEYADQEGQQAHGLQVGGEGGGHVEALFGAAFGGLEDDAGLGSSCLKLLQRGVRPRRRRGCARRCAERRAEEAQPFLGLRDVRRAAACRGQTAVPPSVPMQLVRRATAPPMRNSNSSSTCRPRRCAGARSHDGCTRLSEPEGDGVRGRRDRLHRRRRAAPRAGAAGSAAVRRP